MKTTIEITFRLVVKSSESLDDNSIKAVINDTKETLVESSGDYLESIDNARPESVSVELSKLKISGKLVDLGEFGTPELPWV